MASVTLSRAYNWTFPYPDEEHKMRVVCGDPIAMAYHRLQTWVTAQNFSPPLPMQELIQCLWANHYGNTMTAWSIVRGSVTIPVDIPDDVFNQAWILYTTTQHPA